MPSFEQGKINAEIILKLDSLTTGINQANSKINAFSKQVARDSQANSKAMSAAWAAGFAIISVAAIKAAKKVTAAFKDMIGTYAEFGQSLANTQSVARASAEELDAMEAAARRVGATTRSTASDAANALYYLASAGFTAKESIDALDGVNALAIATQSDLARTSETVATTIRQYGLETSAATDIANTFTAAITSSLATMDKLAKSFEYVGPLAAGLGLSVEETTGALQLLYNKGFSGEKAGRGLRSILADLADSTSVVNKKLGDLGIAFSEVNPATNELADIFDTLRENGIDATNAVAVFGKVSGVQLESLVSIASDAKGGMNELTAAVTGTNRAFEAMDIQMNTLKGSMDKFKNAEEALQISVGKGLDPALTALIDIGTDFVKFLNYLPQSLLSAITILGVLAAVATTTAVAFVGLKLAMASVVVAPVIGAIGAIALPLTLIAGATVAVIAGFEEMERAQFSNAKEQFRGVTEEIEFTAEALENLYTFSDDIIGNLKAINNYETSKIVGEVEKLADSYELTLEQILEVIMSNEELRNETSDLVVELQKHVDKEKELADAMKERWKQAYALTEAEKSARDNSTQYYQQRKKQLDLEKEQKGLIDGLELAFIRARENQKLFGEEFDRNAYLTNIYNNSLKKLVDDGLMAEADAVLLLQKYWKDYQGIYGEVTDGQLTDAQKNAASLDRLRVRLDQNVQSELLAAETRTTYNKKLEDSQAVMEHINYLIGEGFKIEGAAIQQGLDGHGHLIIAGEGRISMLQEYIDKLRDLSETEVERINREHTAAIEKAGTDKEAFIIINKYYDTLRAIAEVEQNDKKITLVKDYKDLLKQLGEDQRDAVERERKAENDHLDMLHDTGKITTEVWKQAKADAKEYFDVLADRAVWSDLADMTQEYGGLVEDVLSSIVDYAGAVADARIAEEQRVYDATTRLRDAYYKEEFDRLEKEKNDALIAAGIVEDDSRQRLVDALEQARLNGDLLTVQRAEEAIERFDILKDYEDKKEALAIQKAEEEEARKLALAQKIADINYDQAMADWQLGKLSVLLNGAVAVMQAMSTGNYVIAAGMGAVTGIQYAAAEEAKPVKTPVFADGGIVPGSSYKGDTTGILANAGELILNQAQQEVVADKLDRNDAPVYITVNTVLDGKVVATNSAKYYRNGQVKL